MVICSFSAGCVIEEKTGYAGNDIKQGDKPFKEDVEDQKACAKLAAANKKAKLKLNGYRQAGIPGKYRYTGI